MFGLDSSEARYNQSLAAPPPLPEAVPLTYPMHDIAPASRLLMPCTRTLCTSKSTILPGQHRPCTRIFEVEWYFTNPVLF